MGHKYNDCWQREENKGKRPNNYRPATGGEQGQANVNEGKGSKIEYLLCGMSFPTDQLMLTDPNVWIANTATTIHTTPHVNGMSNGKLATAEDSITVGNGANKPASQAPCVISMEQSWALRS
jgi:hypothetical protein